jgi:tetratricopeptide (TPR) repeat protein
MELVLTKTAQNQVAVACDGQSSHTFPLSDVPMDWQSGQVILLDPVEMGQRLFTALFAEETPARAAWDARPKRILLVTEDPDLDALPWEYLYGPDGFIVLDVALVRGLPPANEIPTHFRGRQPSPDLSSTPLHIVAVPSNPIDPAIARLDIKGEWTRLKDSLTGLDMAIRLERARPPTLEQTRRLTANQRNRVVHFMGHGGRSSAEACLIFEKDNGAPDLVTARDFTRRLEDTAFLVTLNACASAAPGATEFANLSRALAERGVPYTLGMRSPIPDDDAKAFSQTFYGELARGSSVENALRQARNTLADSRNAWAVGIPVLYTSLAAPSEGFVTPAGTPLIEEHQPPLEISALPRAEGTFQGRVDELLQLGDYLTAHEKVVTLHGPGGQGKTALAREAAERFAHAWPCGVWAVSLEHNSALERFTLELARLLKIDLDSVYKQMAAAHPDQETDVFQGYVQQELERRICHILNNQRALLVVDNAETFVEAVEAKDKSALDLAAFLKEKVLGTQAGLLVTSREHLGWTGEKAIELGGLLPEEGARLFWQSAPGRGKQAVGPLAQEISRKVEGHPLSLRLLGGAFDASGISLDEFVLEVETTLLGAEDKYKHEDHRHRTLFASIETSVRYLDNSTRHLLSILWVFQSFFLPETLIEVLTSPGLLEIHAKVQQKQVYEHLHTLFLGCLLVQERKTLDSGEILLYCISPIVRLFAQHYLAQPITAETLQFYLAQTYDEWLHNIYRQLDRATWATYLAQQCRENLETCSSWLSKDHRGWYANRLGWVLHRIGDRRASLDWLEQALELAQGEDQRLELHILNNMASVYRIIGQPGKAFELFEQTLLIAHEVEDHEGEASILNNMASLYRAIGQIGKALELLKQVLYIRRKAGDREGEAVALNNVAGIYSDTGQPGKALKIYQQALRIDREVGNRELEATTLNNMGLVCMKIGQPDKALELYEQALFMHRGINSREGEAVAMNNIAGVYRAIGQPSKALELLEYVLPIRREVGNRISEATVLSNMGALYSEMGQSSKALELYQHTLPIRREVADYEGEATTLNNIATVYYNMGQLSQALDFYQQALPLMREGGYHSGEATILNNMGALYREMGQPGKALELYEQALFIRRAVSDRAGEATTLNSMAAVYGDMGQPDKEFEFYEQALPIRREVGDKSGEAITLFNMAMLVKETGKVLKAIAFLQQAVELQKQIQHPDYLKDATTLAQWEAEFQHNEPLPGDLE